MKPELRYVWRILVFIVAVLGIQGMQSKLLLDDFHFNCSLDTAFNHFLSLFPELQLLFLVVKWYNSNDPGETERYTFLEKS